MEKLFIREKYLEKIKPFIQKQMIKVLVGSRRVGKSVLLSQLIDTIKEIDKDANIIYINKEFYEFKTIKTDEDLYAYVLEKTIRGKSNYVFIDEVQEIDRFEIVLRQLFAKQYDIYVTGSNAKMLSSDLATHLSGRYIEFRIYPLSYADFINYRYLENSISSLNSYIKYGGLPYLLHLELKEDIIYGYLKSIYNTIILKDVISRYNIRDIEFLDRLVEYLSDSLGSYVSSRKINGLLKSQRISLSINTILNYLKYLAAAYFIEKVQRYDIIGKKRFEINDKYYFGDLGLKHSIIPYKVDDIGKVYENLVYNKLVAEDYEVFVGKHQDKEIDFVAKKGNITKYFQVAYLLPNEKVRKREFGNLLEIPDNFEKIVISADEFPQANYSGIKHQHILDFLMSEKG